MLSMYGIAIGAAGDAQYRSEAANYATELLQAIGGTVKRDVNGGVIASSLDTFSLNPAGGSGKSTRVCRLPAGAHRLR